LYSVAIAAAWYDDLKLRVVGYLSSAVVANQTFTLQVFTLSNIIFTGYSGLSSITFLTYGGTKNANVGGSGTHFAMDDICLSFV
jgi:hypothetical protein